MDSAFSLHKRLLTRLTLALHVTITFVLFIASRLPSFDSSASLVLNSRWPTSLLRWDVFHYAHIALNGYVYEHEYAFFPGTPLLMRIGQQIFHLIGMSANEDSAGVLFAGALASTLVAIDSVHTLYDLSIHHLGSPSMALLASLLSLLSSSPATLRHAPYAEPFFAWLSYRGMLYCAKRHFTRASAAFTLASMFRSNGTMLTGYIIWGMLAEPMLYGPSLHPIISIKSLRKIISTTILALPPILPFLWHQYNGYVAYCRAPFGERRPWCGNRFPLIYSFVQSEYWDVGLFRYWTPQQAPNIILAGPVLVLLVHASVSHIRHTFIPSIISLVRGPRFDAAGSPPPKQSSGSEARRLTAAASDPFMDAAITPHAIHSLILSLILLIAAHTQIALRFACALPFTYWAAAWLFFNLDSRRCHSDSRRAHGEAGGEEKVHSISGRAAHWWVGWSVIWGSISLVTWGVFLPPA